MKKNKEEEKEHPTLEIKKKSEKFHGICRIKI